MTGVNATGDLDVCRAKEIGQKIMDAMTGIPVAQYTFKRSDQVTTVQSKSSVRVDEQPIHVDPELLFQRRIVASNAIDDRKALFRFELCFYPSDLFDDTLMPRAPQKAVLANAIWTRFHQTLSDQVTMSKDVILSNVANKQNFIDMLSHYLQLAGCLTEQAEEDADLLIAQISMQLTAKKNTLLVADDTDLVILLCYYADPDGFYLFMQCSTRGTTKKNRVWDIKVTQSELGADICNNILFIHAILGCGTTSRLYGLGKGLSLKRFTSSALFRDKAEQFCKKDATVDDVIDAGEAALECLYMYSGKEENNIDGLRYAKVCDKVATNKVHIRPQTLPPTSATARYHSMRLYLQVQQWLGVRIMKETDWGWMTKDENLVPGTTDLPPALDELPRVIRCNCTSDCSTARCSCRKHSLECSPACGQCRGIGCSNRTAADISDEDDDGDGR